MDEKPNGFTNAGMKEERKELYLEFPLQINRLL
jgi:hypothetical protein